ncbi:hypothetical protein Y032_0038g3583 [Ancylostoma ceylanicum]|uniref:Uncharacterized protein n=1 Tax=Ancylostoma ceylanicum TaxID=53326 RepID=A0A016UJK3_9BILA|nr:hypothetical protein Y032_0038g3583 [Ancylostoma ceylanicum]
MDRIRRPAVGYKTTLIRRNSDDVADSAVDEAFDYLHAVRQQTYRPIARTIRGVAFPLPDRDCGAPLPIHRSLFIFYDLVEEATEQSSNALAAIAPPLHHEDPSLYLVSCASAWPWFLPR